jgi:predicted transcriptional regulator
VVEIRRRFSTRWVDRSLSIYASEPERKIVGKAQIKAVVPGSPNDIWDVFGCDLACSRAEFDEYVKPIFYSLFLKHFLFQEVTRI